MSNDTFTQFINVTSCDPETAMHFLEAAGYDLETAIQLYFDSTGAAPPSNNNQKPLSPVYIPPEDPVPAPLPQRAQRLIDSSPVGFNPNMNPFAQPMFNMQQFQHQFQQPPQPQVAQNLPSAANNNRQSMFNKLFEKPSHLMFNGSFTAAKDAAKNQMKWLLVHLHDTSDFHSLRMNRDTWKDDVLTTVIEAYFVFWQADITDDEGKKFMNLYKLNGFTIAIVDPRTGALIKTWKDFMSAKQLNEELPKFVDNHLLESHDMPQEEPVLQHYQQQQQRLAPPPQLPSSVQQQFSQPSQGSVSINPNPDYIPVQHSGGEYIEDDPELALAIAASLEGIKQEPSASSVSQEVATSRLPLPVQEEEQQPEEAEHPKQAEEPPVDASVDPSQYLTTSKEGSTRLQLRLPDGSREVVTILLSAPLAAIYALFRSKLPADQTSNKFTVLNFNKELENSLSITLEEMSEIRNASLSLRMD